MANWGVPLAKYEGDRGDRSEETHSLLSSSSKFDVSVSTPGPPSQHISRGLTWWQGGIIFINAIIGAGILNLPYSIQAAGGILTSVLVQIGAVVLIWGSQSAMMWCTELSDGPVMYQDTVHNYLGPLGGHLCSAVIVGFTLLICVNYLLAISQQMTVVLTIWFSEFSWIAQKEAIVFATSCCIFPFLLVKHIDNLLKASHVANASVILVAIVVTFEFFITDRTDVHIKTRPDVWTDIFLAIPAYFMAYMFNIASGAVYERLEKKSATEFMRSSGLALVLAFFFYNIVASLCYLTFGQNIQDNFLANYNSATFPVILAQIAYSVKLCLEYPIYEFIAWTAVRTTMTEIWPNANSWLDHPNQTVCGVNKVQFLMATIWISITASGAFVAESITPLVQLVATNAIHFQFTFPGLILISASLRFSQRFSRNTIRVMKLSGVICVCLGVVLSAVVLFEFVTGV